MQLTNDLQDFLGGNPNCSVMIDCIRKSSTRGHPPVEEPVNDPKKPPVKEPDDPPKGPPGPKVPPVKKPWDIPPAPPVEEPPPKIQTRHRHNLPTKRVVKDHLHL